jgi:hypothetical protein
VGARNAALGGELAAQDIERRILLRINEPDIGQREVDKGARDCERTLSRPRDIAPSLLWGTQLMASISLREELQNRAWLSCTTPFLTRDVSTCASSPLTHFGAIHHLRRRFRSNAYLAPL